MLKRVAIFTAACLTAATVFADPAPNRAPVGNRDPLQPAPFVKLPIGQIKPEGWLRNQLLMEADGMTGHLEEISHWCSFQNSGWADPKSPQKEGWEELPYWLKGYGDLGYVLNDPKIIAETKKWVDVILAGQDDTGWFGPTVLLHSRECDGHVDLWPNMLVLNIMQSWYEYSHDDRVIPFMTRYFKWELDYPDADFLHGYWPKIRAGDNLESVYWLYNRTGDAWLLDLAMKLHRHTANWTKGVANLHNVNFAESFREPVEYWMQAKDEKFLNATQRDYDMVMGTWGQVPGGGFGADENARKGYTDPRQGFETCGMVEYMHSFEMLEKITGDPRWIDRCEDVAFNSFPAAQTADLKGLHYLTCPNQVSLDPGNKSPGVQNRGTMFSYSPGAVYRCCQHNVAMGWPYMAEELWLATADHGLAASIYCASDVTANVADGQEVKISEQTDYPFSDTIELTIATDKPVKFPLKLRIPGWCDAASVKVNNEDQKIDAKPDTFATIERIWSGSDRVTLKLPMALKVRVWEKNKDAISIDRGPLTFALQIGEKWERYGGSDAWPEFSVLPTTAWNVGLIVDEQKPADSFKIVQSSAKLADQPFTPETAPIKIIAKGKVLPDWKTDKNELLEPLPKSPATGDGLVRGFTLIPMGAARLRISSFPTVGNP
jgi:hypothetical protein